jgi:beta-lactamase superfamily II metal-dependent hydrolase
MANVYAAVPELKLLKARTGRSSSTTVLMGAWLKVLDDTVPGWLEVEAFGKKGWVKQADTSTDDTYLKIFFVDVGQGDGVLVETPKGRLLVDGGQYSKNMRNYLTGWKYKWLIAKGFKVKLDAIVVSHFDADHFAGLTSIIENDNFEIGTIFHNGIARFSDTKADRPAKYDKDIGQTDAHGKPRGTPATLLRSSFDGIADARKLLDEGGLMVTFRKFLDAVVKAHDAGRLGSLRRVTTRMSHLPGFGPGESLEIELLGPIPLAATGSVTYPWLADESHTINGHSVVMRLHYGERAFLLGGDLNVQSEEYLLGVWDESSFAVDVAKACHHGSSEFTVDFMKAQKPYASVFSSGDNENYAHPAADALGCSGRYSRGPRPVLFSTELARSGQSGKRIHYGLINCRTDGHKVVLAQMYEKPKRGDMWDSYTVP